jgi:hypothetical protein
MDLQTFEAGLGASPAIHGDSDHGLEEGEHSHGADEIDPDMVLCSVYIERSSSPIVHELVAELHGIPESEAAEMCVGGSVALAENIPLFEANDIKLRCASINVAARIVRRG